jgi:hypothetical protein
MIERMDGERESFVVGEWELSRSCGESGRGARKREERKAAS